MNSASVNFKLSDNELVELELKVFDSLTDQIVVLDDKGFIQLANEAWSSFYAESNQRINWIGLNYLAACNSANGSDDAAFANLAMSGIKDVLANKIPFYSFEYPCKSKWFDCRITSLKKAKKTWAVVCHRDVSLKKQAELELSIAAAAFNTQEAMFVTDSNAIILRVNNSFSEMTGYTETEVIGQTPKLLSSGKHDEAFYQEMWKKIKQDGYWDGEIWNRFKNGEVVPLRLTITAVKDKNGNIKNYLSNFNYILESSILSDEINNLAFYDPLTHLPNRRLIIDRINMAINASKSTNKYNILLLIDLDNFKSINDSIGHQEGDEILIELSKRLCKKVKKGDTVSRLGGDEFGLLLEGVSENPYEAAAVSKELSRSVLSALELPILNKNNEYYLTSSIGISIFNKSFDGYQEVLKQADIAMYDAKKHGRNQVRFFNPEMQDSINNKIKIENEIERALKRNEFEMYYQVQVNHIGSAVGAEALIRWNHPEYGLVTPDYFIEIAEQSNKIEKIDKWVIDKVLAQIAEWSKIDFLKNLTVSINISAETFSHKNFVKNIHFLIKKYSVEPTKIKLELVESTLIKNIEKVVFAMNELSNIGILFSLDDFGTGYSSLKYLKSLPFNQLKIDQSFVKNLEADFNDRSIVRTVIAMANSLGYEVIAEGVETEKQRSLLINKGCVLFQGYLFSKPLPSLKFEELITKLST